MKLQLNEMKVNNENLIQYKNSYDEIFKKYEFIKKDNEKIKEEMQENQIE